MGVTDAGGYQPADIAVNPRGTPVREQDITFDPALRVTDGRLCIPPTFYAFPKKGQFIVESVLTSKKHPDAPRRIVAGLAISDGYITNMPLTGREILRPYSEVSQP